MENYVFDIPGHSSAPVTFLMRYEGGRHYVAPVGTSLAVRTGDSPAWCEYTVDECSPAGDLVRERNELARCNANQVATIERLQKTIDDQKRVILLLTQQNESLNGSIRQHAQIRRDKDTRITQLLGELGGPGIGRSPLELKVVDLETRNAKQVNIIQSLDDGIAARDASIEKLKAKAKRRSIHVNDLRATVDDLQAEVEKRDAKIGALHTALIEAPKTVNLSDATAGRALDQLRSTLRLYKHTLRVALDQTGVHSGPNDAEPNPLVELRQLINAYYERGKRIRDQEETINDLLRQLKGLTTAAPSPRDLRARQDADSLRVVVRDVNEYLNSILGPLAVKYGFFRPEGSEENPMGNLTVLGNEYHRLKAQINKDSEELNRLRKKLNAILTTLNS